MNIETEVTQFLNGERFSSGLSWTIGRARLAVPTRWDIIGRLCKGKDVLHIGFADHLPLIEQKYREGRWLHGQLRAVARTCVGIDINEDAVQFVRDRLGVDCVYVADVTKELPSDVSNVAWNVVVLGEILEHLDDAGSFLRSLIRSLKLREDTKLIVTVPNATSYLSVRAALHNKEYVNTDHRYWFSPYTIAKLLTHAGWAPEEITFCEPSAWWRSPRLLAHPLQTLHRTILSLWPTLSETVVVVATPKSTPLLATK